MAKRKETCRQGKSGSGPLHHDRAPNRSQARPQVAELPKSGTAKLSLVATPIGNLGDLSPRSSAVLTEADFWIVEDTRVSGKLASFLGLRKMMRVANEHTSETSYQRMLSEIQAGRHAALVSDGGAPGVSDPGARIVDLAYEQGIEVDAIPGPSAVINALMLSGFYAQRFAFLGFLGRKPGEIRQELAPFTESPFTLVLFESQHRFRNLLQITGEMLGPRRYAICREISKLNQQVFRERLPTIPSEAEVVARGEFTIVIEGRRKSHERGEPRATI